MREGNTPRGTLMPSIQPCSAVSPGPPSVKCDTPCVCALPACPPHACPGLGSWVLPCQPGVLR
jgi:hypothetical protein